MFNNLVTSVLATEVCRSVLRVKVFGAVNVSGVGGGDEVGDTGGKTISITLQFARRAFKISLVVESMYWMMMGESYSRYMASCG